MGERHKGKRQVHQHRRHDVTTVGTQGTYTYDPGLYYIYPTSNGARHVPFHGNIPRYHDNQISNKTSEERSFDEDEGPVNAPRSRRRIIAVTFLFILIGVIVLGVIAGVVIALVDRDDGNDYASTTSEHSNTETSTKQTTPLDQTTQTKRQTVTSTSTPLTYPFSTPTKGATPPSVSTSVGSSSTAASTTVTTTSNTDLTPSVSTSVGSSSTAASTTFTTTSTTDLTPSVSTSLGSSSTAASTTVTTTSNTDLTTTEQPLYTITTDIITNSPNTVTTTFSTESTTRESCSNPVIGRFYAWIPLDDNADIEQIFSQIKEAMLPSDSICTLTNFGLIQNMDARRRKRATEVGSLVIGIEVTQGEFTKSDVMQLLTTAALTGVEIETVRIDDVSEDCILLGTTGSISERMCRDLGFVYSELHDYEYIDRIVWKGLPDFQEQYGNVSCDPASRDVAFCSVFYPDCKAGKQLCPGICDDVKMNCPSVFQSLSLPEQYCDRPTGSDECYGNIKNIPCDPQTQFKCPDTELCIFLASLCDGNVDCLTSEIDEDKTVCDSLSSTTTSNITIATPITPIPNDCGDDEFGCVSDGDCIPNYWFCDDYLDCEDGSDEVLCFCPGGTFRCEISIPTVCVDEVNVCDNVADCADSSDERDCSGKNVECKENEFRCITFPECIASSKHCDGTADCQDKSDEWYDCPAPLTPPPITDFEVRLMQNATETTSELVGRVELREKGTQDEFGTICGDMWTQEDVNVICRMLNSSFDGAAFAYKNAAFGQGNGNILMTNVDCHGNETNIGLCKSKRSNIHCSHQLDAAVSCGQYIDIPTRPTVQTATVRLLNGGTCLEGLVQVNMRDEWRFVCDDRFDKRDATVICRMLGFDSAPGMVEDFGIGDGVFWLDEVKCRGNETEISQCTYNELGDHDCLYYEAVGVVCGGIPESDCSPESDCMISSSCSFDTDDCCLDFPDPNINAGSTKWIRHRAGMIGYYDHTTGSTEGGIIYYRNVFGSKDDMATVTANTLLKSNRSFSTGTNLTLAFYYLVQSPRIAGLSVKTIGSGESGTMLWSSPFIPEEMEGLWLYQCVDLPHESITDLVFEGRRGRKADEIIAIDDVALETGRCQNGLLHQECSFDDFGLCGEEIICDTCVQGDDVYRWRVISNGTDVRDNVQVSQIIQDNMQGGFMLADASYGLPSEKAVMKLDLEDGASIRAIQFEYMVLGDEPNSLQFFIKTEESTEYIWQSQSVILRNTLQVGCIQLPTITTTSMYIEAVRGGNSLGDIALDNVRMVDRCQGFTNCVAGSESCNYTIESPMTDGYTWVEEDYVADGEIHKAYRLEDNSSPYGARSRVISPEFFIGNGQYQLSFSMLKQGTGTFKIYITNGLIKKELYTSSLYYADDFERYCITVNLTDMNGATLVLESMKGSLGLYKDILNDTEVVVVRDVDLKPGTCKNNSLLRNTCSFDDHLCVYEIENSPGISRCEPVYEWFRNGGSFNYNLLKSDTDHSTHTINGRYMSVVHQEGLQPKSTSLRFESMNIQDENSVKAVSLYIRMFDMNLEQSDLFITVSGVKFDVRTHLLPLDVWQPVCIAVSNLQTDLIDVSITAGSVTCDIDDVSLLNMTCPGSVDCSFDAENNCGYTLENGWKQTDGYVQVSEDGSRLISPVLNTDSESCLEFSVRSEVNGSRMIRGITQLLDKQTLKKIKYEQFIIRQTTEWKMIQFKIPAVTDTVLAISFTDIGLDAPIFVDEVSFSNQTCNPIVCNAEEHACGNSYCISTDHVCDWMVDCPDKSDETNCDYCSHCYFKVYDECLCSFTSVNVKAVSFVNASSSMFELSGGKLISQVETPLLNVTVHSCLKLLVTYADSSNASLRIIRKDSYLLYPLATIQDVGSEPGDANVSVTLDPGLYSLVFEMLSLNPSTTGLVLTLKDIEITQGICEPDTIESTTIAITTTSMDNTTNNPGDDGDIKAYIFTDVTLECMINVSSSTEETTLFWYKDGRQLTINDDIVNQAYVDTPNDANIPKYTVSRGRDSQLVYMYNLIIKQVTEQDAGKYECKLDTPITGISVENTFVVEVVNDGPMPTADGCFRNTLDTCFYHGFEAIQDEGPFGRQLDTQGLIFTLNQLENSLTSGQCKSAIESLTCGLCMPKCVDGSTINMCKEYCHEIVSTCLQEDSDVYQLLQYGCDFLQSSEMDHTCYSEWIGCGITHNNQEGIIWSENYPEAYGQTNCSTHIHADKYHSLQLDFIDVNIGSGGGVDPCCFEVYDEDTDEVVLRRECGEAFDVDTISIQGEFVRATFVSNGESQGRGYKIAYKQVLRYGCTLIPVHEISVVVTPNVLKERTEDRSDQCTSALLYTEDTRDLIELDVNAVPQGCVVLSSIDDNGDATMQKTICNSLESATYKARGQVLMETDETALYSINVRKKTYVRQVDTISLDDDGRLVITSEEKFGIACVEVDQPTADIACRSLNLGWPAKITVEETSSDLLPSIVYNIACEGNEQQISDCRWSFEDQPKTCSRDTISLVTCKEVSLSCDFYESTCGYSLNGDVQFSYEEGLVLQKPDSFTPSQVYGVISSPVFQYSEDTYVHFGYAVDADLGDAITIELQNLNTKTSTVLWERMPYKVSGYLKGCFALPDIQEPEAFFMLTIKLSSPRSGVGYAAFVTAVRRLVISPEKCEGTDFPLVCTFENPDTCALMTDMDDMACSPPMHSISPTAVLISAYLYRDRNWLEDSFFQRGEYNNYMLVNDGQDVTLLQNIPPDTVSLRFSYAVYLAPGITHLTWRLLAEGATVLVVHDEQTSWKSTCVDIQDYTKQTFVLKVGDKLGNYNEFHGFSSLAIDNIQLTSDLCPHPNSCGFEDTCRHHYVSVNGTSGWKRISSGTDGFPVSDVTYRIDGKGSFMVPDFVGAAESEMAVMETKHIGTNLQCLAFYLYTGVNSSSTLKIVVNGKEPLPLKQYMRGEWLLNNIELAGRIDSVHFVATQGYSQGVLAIDEVILTETMCKDTLNNKNLCTFDNPSLCSMKTTYGQNAQFDMNMLHTKTGGSDLSKLLHDADGNFNGSFMFLEGSESDVTAEITFTVNTAKSAYRFWYYISSDATSNIAKDLELFTVVGDAIKSVIELTVTNTWVMSPCFPVTMPFSGILRIGATINGALGMLVAIDNVELLDVELCHDYSPTCDFTKGQTCGYISEGQIWSHNSNSWFTQKSGNLSVPTMELTYKPHCFEFEYELHDMHTVDGMSKLTLLKDDVEEMWFAYATLKKGDQEPLTGRVNIFGGAKLNMKFISDGAGLFKLLKTSLSDGSCIPQQECDSADEFRCQDKCIDLELVCNGVVHCLHGEDEMESLCGFKLITDFNTLQSVEKSGFKEGTTSPGWTLVTNEVVSVGGISRRIPEQTLSTKFNSLTISPAVLESRQYYIDAETSCLYISYYGNVAKFTLSQEYQDPDKNILYEENLAPSVSKRHIAVPVQRGKVHISLSVYLVNLDPYYRGDVPTSGLFGLYSFEIHPGVECSDMAISCPEDIPNMCRNKMACFTKEEKCNLIDNCMDKSDETDDCGYGIPCDFEHRNMCGYRNVTVPKTYWDDRDVFQTPQTLWERTYTNTITRPNFDHTFHISGKGYFMTSKNYEGLQDEKRYVDTEIMQSPYQIFNSDGCITFWYYLNSTAHQPKTGTAQLFVYIQYGDDTSKELLWYDHVNRPFTDWFQGGIPVQGNRNTSLVIKAVTFIPYDSWTGVVSVDDIGYHTGDCMIQRPECDDTMYKCDDNICIPHAFVCDGEADCHDGQDEKSCDRPEGGLQLVGGDGSYGQLGYFYSGQWRPVCYPSDPLDQRLFGLLVAHNVCRSLGFSGNSDAIPYRLWSKHSDTSMILSCDVDGKCDATPTMENCGFYAYTKCSNEVCFSGETLCPGTVSTCKPRYYFCDGETDCPWNTDEINCKCFEEEKQCIHIEAECKNIMCDTCHERGMFECKNHHCIPLSERCDGVSQCGDGSDEYRCVQIDDDGLVTIFDRISLQRKAVCVNDIGVEIAQTLCRLSGKGYISEIHEEIVPLLMVLHWQIPCLMSNLQQECGTTSIQDSLVRSFVINGRDTTIEEWPWYGALLADGYFVCGAALIGSEWVLTAAHCVTPGIDYSVIFGFDTPGLTTIWRQTATVSRIFNYGYDGSGTFLFHDITLLKLSQPIQINNYTRPICLPQQNTTDHVREMGTRAECYVVGIGATEKIFNDPSDNVVIADVLQKKRVRIVPNDFCEQEWRKGVPSTEDPFPENIYCIATQGPSSPSCFGDSGGPVMCKNARGRWELIGSVSFGYGNCQHDIIPSVATSVPAYGEWIERVTGLTVHSET